MKKFNKKISNLFVTKRIIESDEQYVLIAEFKEEKITLATYSNMKNKIINFIPINKDIENNIINLSSQIDTYGRMLVDELISLSRRFSKVEENVIGINVDTKTLYDGTFIENVKFIDEKDEEQIAFYRKTSKENSELNIRLYSKKDLAKIEKAFLKKYENSKNFEQISKIFRDFLKEQYQISKYEKRQSAFIEPNIDSKIIRLS